MFGLEQNQKEPFAYDIEKLIRKDAKKAKEILDRFASHKHEIETILKTETKDPDLVKLKAAYEKAPEVIKRIKKSK